MPLNSESLKLAIKTSLLSAYTDFNDAASTDTPTTLDDAADDIAEAIASAVVTHIVGNLTVIAPSGGGGCAVT